MFTFYFKYSDGSEYFVKHIEKATYHVSESVTVDSNNMLTHCFPLGRCYQLFSKSSNTSLDTKNVIVMDIYPDAD